MSLFWAAGPSFPASIGKRSSGGSNAELIDTYIALRDQLEEEIRHLERFPYSRAFYYELL